MRKNHSNRLRKKSNNPARRRKNDIRGVCDLQDRVNMCDKFIFGTIETIHLKNLMAGIGQVSDKSWVSETIEAHVHKIYLG